jgi:hypothetical protein
VPGATHLFAGPKQPLVDLDEAGNAIVTLTENSASRPMRTLKYAAADGHLIWTSDFGAGPGNSERRPLSFRIASNGDVVIVSINCPPTGYPEEGPCVGSRRIARLSATDGSEVWSVVEATGSLFAGMDSIALSLDSSDNVIVVVGDVKKYAGANGALLWSVPMFAASHADDAGAVTALPSQDVVVAGGGAVARLSGADGHTLWNLPEIGGSSVPILALTSGGDLVVAWPSYRQTTLMRVAALDGAITWTRTFPGKALEIAVDPFDRITLAAGTLRQLRGASGTMLFNVAMPQVSEVSVDPSGRIFASDGYTLAAIDPVLDPRRLVDFDGDGRSDVLWQHTDGRVAVWLMDGAMMAAGAEILPAGTGWRVLRAVDFDGDGKTDLLWRHGDGRVAIWLMDGLALSSSAEVLPADSGWTPTHVADLDADGRADILFRNDDGSAAAWLMDGLSVKDGATLLGPGSGWQVQLAGDVDGNRLDDIVWKRDDGTHVVWRMNGLSMVDSRQIHAAGAWQAMSIATFIDVLNISGLVWNGPEGIAFSQVYFSPELLPAAGYQWGASADFDGDAHSEILVRSASGETQEWRQPVYSFSRSAQGLTNDPAWMPAGVGDFDGDGKSDILWRHEDGRVAIWMMDGFSLVDGREILGAGTGWSPLITAP